MKSHEIEVKNKAGKKMIVSVEHYQANAGDLTPTMDKKDVDAYCEKHNKAKAEQKAKMLEDAEKASAKESKGR